MNLWSGQSIGLDTDVRAVSFDQVTKGLARDASTNLAASNAPSLDGHEYKDFVAYSIQGRTAKKKYTTKKGVEASGVMGSRGGDMPPTDFRAAVDAAKINAVFDQFIDVLINQAEIVNKDDNVTFLKNYDWTTPRAQFARGINSGMTALLKNVGDLTGKAEALGQQHGANEAFDPRVFKIRAMYANLRRSGIAEVESMEVLELYAEHLVKGGTEDSFEHWVRIYVLERAAVGAATPVTPTMPTAPKKPVRRPVIKARPRGKLAVVGKWARRRARAPARGCAGSAAASQRDVGNGEAQERDQDGISRPRADGGTDPCSLELRRQSEDEADEGHPQGDHRNQTAKGESNDPGDAACPDDEETPAGLTPRPGCVDR